jgi:hypothetical protein
MTKTVMTLALMSACTVSWAQGAAHFTVNHMVHFTEATAQSNVLLANIPQAKDLLEGNTYQFAYEDLKGDGTKEIIIQARGDTWCGSAGCLMLVLEKRGSDYVTLLSENVGDSVAVMNERVNGYAALKAAFGVGMNMKPKIFLLGDHSSATAQVPPSQDNPKATSSAYIVQFVRGNDNSNGPFTSVPLFADILSYSPSYSFEISGRGIDPHQLGYILHDDESYAFAVLDLRGDGTKQYAIKSLYCKGYGCFTMIAESRNNRLVQIFADVIGGDLTVLPQKVNGYAVLRAPHPANLAGKMASQDFAMAAGPNPTYSSVMTTTKTIQVYSDDTSRPLPEAIVKLTNRQTGVVYHAVRNPKYPEYYDARNVISGAYDISVTIPIPNVPPRVRSEWIFAPQAVTDGFELGTTDARGEGPLEWLE